MVGFLLLALVPFGKRFKLRSGKYSEQIVLLAAAFIVPFMIPLASALLELLFLSFAVSLFISDWSWLVGSSSRVQKIALSCVTLCFILGSLAYVVYQGFQMDWWRYFSIVAAIAVGGFFVVGRVAHSSDRKGKPMRTPLIERSFVTPIVGVVTFLLVTYASNALFTLNVSLVKDLIDITLELLGLGAILFAALELLEHTFLEVSKKHKEVADTIKQDIVDTPVHQKMPPWQRPVAELRRLDESAIKIAASYSTLKRILGAGFIYPLGLDIILQITHLLLYANLSVVYVYSFPLGNLLFSFETAIVILALCNLLVGVHVSVARPNE
jgi:hypothetical protein